MKTPTDLTWKWLQCFLEVFVMCFLNDVLQNTFILITKGFFFGSGKIFGHREYLGK